MGMDSHKPPRPQSTRISPPTQTHSCTLCWSIQASSLPLSVSLSIIHLFYTIYLFFTLKKHARTLKTVKWNS